MKGGRWCSASGCKNNSNSVKKSFFKFPKDPGRWLIWVNSCGRTDLLYKGPLYAHKNCELCSDHFEQRMYLNDLKTRLMPSAIPTLKLQGFFNNAITEEPVADNAVTDERSANNEAASLVEPESHSNTDVAVISIHEPMEQDSVLPTLAVPVADNLSSELPVGEVSSSSIGVQTSQAMSSDTPRKRKLRAKLKSARRKVARLQHPVQDQLDMMSEMTLDDFKNSCDKFLPPTFSKIAKQQAELHSMKGNRYTNEFKQSALSWYFQSPKLYKTLSKLLKLPSVRCLQRYTENWDTSPGLSANVLAGLKFKGQCYTAQEKQCILCADEMSLKRNLFYNLSKYRIVGFHDTGHTRKLAVSEHVLVLMARGISKNWKQPLGYYFVDSSISCSELEVILVEAIEKLQELQFNVHAVVTDMGSNFKKFVSTNNITIDQPYFMVNDRKIFYMYDMPYMMKAVRNNLLKYDFQFYDYMASWDHIESYYKKDSQKAYRSAPKLTPAHIQPTNFQRMKVRYATQVFSSTVAAALSTYLSFNELPAQAAGTIELIDKFDKLFDLFNPSKLRGAEEYNMAFTGSSKQLALLDEM